MLRMDSTQHQISCSKFNQSREQKRGSDGLPAIDHKPFTPRSRQTPFSSPSGSSPQMGPVRSKTASPQTFLMCSPKSPILKTEADINTEDPSEKRGPSPGSKNDDISMQLAPVLKLQPSLCEALKWAVVLQLDLAFPDELASSSI
jgi:hypothetical protein